VLHLLIPASRRWPRIFHGPATMLVGWIARRIRREAVTVARDVVTQSLMVLSLPKVVLMLGRNLDAPVPLSLGGPPPPFLGSLTREYDPCPPGGTACAARDWCDLRQRMHYIVHVFRAFADDPRLSSRPFTPDQVACFRAGGVPTGEL
jgi:hypothetical protein